MIEAAHKDALRERAAAAAKLQEAHDVIAELRALLSEERNKCSKVQQQTHTHYHPQPSSPQSPLSPAFAFSFLPLFPHQI